MGSWAWGAVAAAPPLFPDPVARAAGDLEGLAAADFNGDGILDLAAAGQVALEDGAVLILLGRGDGRFEPEIRYAAGDASTAVAVADFDLDGLPDLAVANTGSTQGSRGDVVVLLNLGAGRFSAPRRLTAGDRPWSIAAGDLDHDGDADLAVANAGSDDVSVFLGHGDGTFGPAAAQPTGSVPEWIAVADFDGDERTDLVTRNAFGDGISVLRGRGDGTFETWAPVAAAGPALVWPAVADFDGDGRDDLAIARPMPGGVFVLLGRADGTFALPLPSGGTSGLRLAGSGDFDGDGRPDLAAVSLTNGAIVILVGRGDGAFDRVAGSRPTALPAATTTGDFDGDGHLDLAVASRGVSILQGLGDGSFAAPPRFAAGAGPVAVAAADLDGDGDADLAVANHGSDDVSILKSGDGAFAPQSRLAAGDGPAGLVAGDFDGDQRLDLAVANHLSDDVSILFGRAGGPFAPPDRVPAGRGPSSLAAGDFDADGDLDLAVANLKSGDVTILMGQGDGRFFAARPQSGGDAPIGIIAADLDRDGDTDLAVLSGRSLLLSPGGLPLSALTVLLGRGDGSFEARPPLALAPSAFAFAAADFDADGLLDLAVSHRFAEEVAILRGAGDGDFALATVLEGGAGTCILAADLDGDGHVDLATVDPGANEVIFRAGRGDASFGAPRGFRAGSSPSCPAAADLDGDAAPDLAIPSRLTDEVWILRNRGGGPVRPPRARTAGDARFECTSPAGAATLLDGTASSDPDSTPGTRDDIVSYHWYEEAPPGGRFLGAGERLEVGLALGTHTIVLRVADSNGEIDTDEAVVDVTDTTPPELTIALSPALLWPPDHRLVEITASGGAGDACGPATFVLESIKSDEPDDGAQGGDGRTGGDIQDAETGVPDLLFRLRAERSGGGDGRTYTVTYRATDAAGNVRTVATAVLVPRVPR